MNQPDPKKALGADAPAEPRALEVIFHPNVTEEQQAKTLEILGDLFEAAGGKGGLKIESVEEIRDE